MVLLPAGPGRLEGLLKLDASILLGMHGWCVLHNTESWTALADGIQGPVVVAIPHILFGVYDPTTTVSRTIRFHMRPK